MTGTGNALFKVLSIMVPSVDIQVAVPMCAQRREIEEARLIETISINAPEQIVANL